MDEITYKNIHRSIEQENPHDYIKLALAIAKTAIKYPKKMEEYQRAQRLANQIVRALEYVPEDIRYTAEVSINKNHYPMIAVPKGKFTILYFMKEEAHEFQDDKYESNILYSGAGGIQLKIETPFVYLENPYRETEKYLNATQHGIPEDPRDYDTRDLLKGLDGDRFGATKKFVIQLEKYLTANQEALNYSEKIAEIEYAQELRKIAGMKIKDIVTKKR